MLAYRTFSAASQCRLRMKYVTVEDINGLKVFSIIPFLGYPTV